MKLLYRSNPTTISADRNTKTSAANYIKADTELELFEQQLDEMFSNFRNIDDWYDDYGDPIYLTSFVDDIMSGYEELDYDTCYDYVADMFDKYAVRYI